MAEASESGCRRGWARCERAEFGGKLYLMPVLGANTYAATNRAPIPLNTRVKVFIVEFQPVTVSKYKENARPTARQ